MRRFGPSAAAVLVLLSGGVVSGQATRDSRPVLPKDPLSAMALPPAPDGIRTSKQPVVTIDRTSLETDDLGREIAAFYWAPAVEALLRRTILDLELAAKKIKLSPDSIEQEAARILAALDPSVPWSHVAATNPSVAADIMAQARDAVGWDRLMRAPDAAEDDDGGDPNTKQILSKLGAKLTLDRYKVRKRDDGDPLGAGIAADVTAPDGRTEVILERQVLDHLRVSMRQDELVLVRESLIDDWLLGRELVAIGDRVDPARIAKTVAAMKEKYRPPFDWKMICQFKGTTVAREIATFRRLDAWRKLTAFAAKPEDLQAFAKDREGYYRGENRMARHILFRTADGMTGAPLDGAVQAQAESDAKEAYEALKKGADFDELARAKSEDGASAQRGGAPQQAYKQFDANLEPAMRDAIFALNADAPLSKPVKGAKGWYVFKLDKVNPPAAKLKLDDPKVAEWIMDDYDRVKLAEYVAALRKKSAIKPGSETVLTTGW
jgi:hypothetical protein